MPQHTATRRKAPSRRNSQTLRTVRLNGELGRKYGRVHRLAVSTPHEAVRALCANHPAIYGDLLSSESRGVGYKVLVDGDKADEERLGYPMSRTFSITPVVAGAGKIGEIIAGVALLSVAIFAPEVIPAFLSAQTVGSIGLALTLGGVAQLLAPTPTAPQAGQQQNNRYFDGAVNNTAQGAPVPIGYGRMVVGSAVISAGITVEQQQGTPSVIPNFYGGGIP
ncbi:MAG: tail assembly protein [Betaproteobacteria bacterium]|nr:tail assembly protein [Betaproteobacteria bacterium]